MHILFISEYFYPFTHGGSEQSIYFLAKGLIEKNLKVSVLTLNYGTQKNERWKKINIYRCPFFIKMSKKHAHAISPFLLLNFFTQFIVLTYILYVVLKYKIGVIHIHSSFLIIPGIIAAKLLKKPVVVTVRDYQTLCPLGFCLNKKNNYKTCSIKNYITKDMAIYINGYISNKSFIKILFFILGALRSKLYSRINKLFLKKADKIVCISKKERIIFRCNNVNNTTVIYNSFDASLKKFRKKNQITFVGRLTYGKGAHLLINSFIGLFRHYKRLNLVIVGQGFLNSKITDKVEKNKLVNQVKIMGSIDYKKTLKIIAQSKLVIVPSLWEEPFGRVALESIMLGTPAVVSNRGGLKEIIENGYSGYVVDPVNKSLTKAIRLGLEYNNKLTYYIQTHKKQFQYKFNTHPTVQYINIYKSL